MVAGPQRPVAINGDPSINDSVRATFFGGDAVTPHGIFVAENDGVTRVPNTSGPFVGQTFPDINFPGTMVYFGLKPSHARMPAILPPDVYDVWLDPEAPP